MSGEFSWRIEFPPGMELLSANGREHWRKRSKVTAELRKTARLLAKKQKIPKLDKVRVKAIYHAPNNRRRDTSNFFPSIKAIVDGLVDSGMLADDSDKYVVSLEIVRADENVRDGQLIIEVTEENNGGSS